MKRNLWSSKSKWWNKNKLTGLANSKKTTRHYVCLSLCTKSRKTNDANSIKWPKTSIWAYFFLKILRSNISKLQVFLKNKFHWNWRSCLVLTSGQKPKKAVFEKNIKVSDFGLIWRPFCEYLQIKIFFLKSSSVTFLPLQSPNFMQKIRKILRPVSEETTLPTNQALNQPINANLETFSQLSSNQKLFSKILLCDFSKCIAP